ncbi:MAG: LCP family protein [Eubacterium sp.]|nr:LCP family protein [Eubacterium sp.]
MSKDNYNIDDILSEIKKHKEESFKEKETENLKVEEEAVSTADITEKEEQQEEVEEPVVQEPETVQEESEVISEEEITEEKELPDEDIAPNNIEAEADEMVDILSLSENEELSEDEDISEDAENEEAPKKKKKKKAKIIIAVVALIVVVAIALGAVFANDMIDKLVNNGNTMATTEEPWQGMDKLIKDFAPIDETEATQLSSLKDMIKTWYYNGKPCSSSHVLNVMFIGEDTRGKEILDEGTRADSAIIVSINIDTGVVTLTSILRDAYTYWETTEGDESTGQFGKINGAMSTGDINAYINCVEHMYKIKIDNYAIVNFDSFETIVDTLGGVTLELTEAEINEINNHQVRYNHVTIEKTFEGNKGKMKLTGKQALAYCRIRKLDSDNMRADRQKTCIAEIFKQTRKASTVRLLRIIKKLIPYVNTNFSKNEILKIAKYAFSQGWLDYDIYMQTLPEENLKGGMGYGAWIWKCDFPADAYNLQYIIYGESNITLAHIRPDTAKCPEEGFFEDGDAAMDMQYTKTNTNYGEVTVVTTTTKKHEETTTSN